MIKILRATVILQLALQPFTFGIMNEKIRRDSYLTAYMESQSSTEGPVGVVYAEPFRTYGPPQHKPMTYYEQPSVPSGPPNDYPSSQYPLLEAMLHLPEKLEFLPKLVSTFLGVTHILLKLVLLKLVLKFVVMFCLFFFLPKLEMLDMATEPEKKPTADALNNSTSVTPADDEEERRLNFMTNFILDSIENQPFLKTKL